MRRGTDAGHWEAQPQYFALNRYIGEFHEDALVLALQKRNADA
jgi:hypothetical protein